jgi:serine/threonine-protein kinase
MVMGTPDYMAPEQARGDRVDARADVYAVGAILYRALTGRKPFEGLDPMQTLTAALVQEPPRPSSIEPTIPIELELLMQHAMAKEPRERFQTMDELDAALSAFDPANAVLPVLANAKATIDVSGKTVVSQPGVAAPAVAVERSVHSARLARPALAFFTSLGFLWLVTSVVVAVGAFIRQLRLADLTAAETVLLPVGAVAAAATPAVVWVRYLAREVWPSTPRAVEMGSRLRRTVLYSASAYGISALFVHLFEGVVQRNGAGLARPGWALMAFVVALTVGVATWVMTRRRR